MLINIFLAWETILLFLPSMDELFLSHDWSAAQSVCILLQFESIAGFGAIIDRLGQFAEVLEPYGDSPLSSQKHDSGEQESSNGSTSDLLSNGVISLEDLQPTEASPLLQLHNLSLRSPDGSSTLVEDLSLEVTNKNVLMDPSEAIFQYCNLRTETGRYHLKDWKKGLK